MRLLLRLIVGYVAFVVLPIATLHGAYYFKIRASLHADESVRQQAFASIQRDRVVTYVTTLQERTDSVTSRRIFRELLRDYLAKPSKELQYQMERSLTDVRYAVPDFEVLSVADVNGKIIVSTDPALRGADYSSDPMFIRGKQANAIAIDVDDAPSPTPRILLASPFVLDDRVIGVGLFRSRSDGLLALLGGSQDAVRGTCTLVQRVDAQTVAAVRSDHGNAALSVERYSGDRIPPLYLRALQGEEPVVMPGTTPPSQTLQVARFIPSVGWALIHEVPDQSRWLVVPDLLRMSVLTLLFTSSALVAVALHVRALLRSATSRCRLDRSED